jgi:hypothetical protein
MVISQSAATLEVNGRAAATALTNDEYLVRLTAEVVDTWEVN